MKFLRHSLMACAALVCAAQLSHAQSANVYFGLGTATDSSSHQNLDLFNTGTGANTPKLTGLFPDIGASVLFTRHLGAGFDASWRGAKGDYSGVQYRTIFYNFDGIYTPISSKRFEPEFHAGIGGTSVHFSYDQQSCSALSGCSTSTVPVDSSTHFQFHLAAAARLYVTDHVFVRPAFDAHYVNNFFQFGSNWVPQYSVGIGYSFGRE